MSGAMKAKLGIAPIAWSNDDLPELGGETTLETCLSETRQAGFSGIETGGKFPTTAAELRPILDAHGLQLASEDAHTMGGLVMESLTRVARPGDVVHHDNVRLEVERVSGRRVVTILVTPVDEESGGGGRETP